MSPLSDSRLCFSGGGHVLGHVAAGGEPGAPGRAGQARGPAGPQSSRPGRARHQVRCNQREGEATGTAVCIKKAKHFTITSSSN